MDDINLIGALGICIAAAALCRVLDNGGREYGVLLKTAAVAAVVIAAVSALSPIISEIEALYGKTNGNSLYLTIMLKAVGICFLTRFAADICRDSGETALGSAAETVGKISLLLLALPLFEAVTQTIERLL
ncbi:MAG: hypothetical protein LIO69_05225 [Oscillospiraceae bacterium]|nr:hypothetical protein [Oscillospiraceae bacterium]